MSIQLNMLAEVTLKKIAKASKSPVSLGTKNLPTTSRPTKGITFFFMLGEPKLPKKLQK